MIWVSMIFVLLFFVIGLIGMSMPGVLPRFTAIPSFIFILPIIAGRQVLWTEGPLAIQTVPLPALVASLAFSFFTMWVYVATVNFLETPLIDRDYLGRKRKRVK